MGDFPGYSLERYEDPGNWIFIYISRLPPEGESGIPWRRELHSYYYDYRQLETCL